MYPIIEIRQIDVTIGLFVNTRVEILFFLIYCVYRCIQNESIKIFTLTKFLCRNSLIEYHLPAQFHRKLFTYKFFHHIHIIKSEFEYCTKIFEWKKT